MNTTLKLMAAAFLAGAMMAGAAEEAPEKNDKEDRKAKAGGLATADKNTDGKITLDEFKAWAVARPKPMTEERAEKAFQKRDTNGDGEISKEEMRPARPAREDKPEGKKKKE